jgi:hypothetical protein
VGAPHAQEHRHGARVRLIRVRIRQESPWIAPGHQERHAVRRPQRRPLPSRPTHGLCRCRSRIGVSLGHGQLMACIAATRRVRGHRAAHARPAPRRDAPRRRPRRTGRGRRAVAALLMALGRLGTERPEIAEVDSRHQRWCAESPHFAALPLHDHAGFLLGRSVVWTSRESLGREGSRKMATPARLEQRTSPGMRSLRRARNREVPELFR